MKVYVVEDSPVVQERLVAMLHDIPGLEVVGVSDNAVGALADILSLRPDVAVLDIRLREGNGIDVLKGIRREDGRMTVIVLTNYASRTIRERCLAAGADHFFDKSTELDRLRTVLGTNNPPGPHAPGAQDDNKEDRSHVWSNMPPR